MIRRLSSGWSVFSRPYRVQIRLCSGKPPGDDEWWGDNAQPSSLFDDVDEEDDHSKKSDKPIIRRPVSEFKAAPVRRAPVVEGTPRISLSEALYLAKEAGVFTTREVQTHLIKSPSFSTNDSPFLLENFFVSENEATIDPYSADLKSGQPGVSASTTKAEATNSSTSESESRDVIPESIHQALSGLSQNVPCFVARNREWKVRSEGKGTRKRATAHVLIEKGTGIVKVNGEEDFFKRFPLLSNRFDVLYPMEACGASGLFDVYIAVKGGGISGQAGAARLALGRALVSACAECEDDLKDSLVLFEDTRQKTSKFAEGMCKLCFVASERIVIPPMPSKFKKGVYVNSTEIVVERNEKVLDVIRESVENPYEALAVYEWVMKGERGRQRSRSEIKEPDVNSIKSGLDQESYEFERALNFLSQTNPARMKTIEHLEANYRRSMLDMKKQRASAVSSLQTRQSLEMDMLMSSKHSKPDLESMVHQHVSEMDALIAFWDVEIRTLHQRQLVEYRELVSEVVASEGMTPESVSNIRVRKPRIYARPEIDKLEWISMQPVAVVSDVSRRARLVRLTRMSGDILSALFSPLPFDDSSLIDPEEEESSQRSLVRSAVLLGTESFKSNQDTELRNRIDMKCPSDCRWPSLGEQIELLGTGRISKTRHSNIAHGIGTIFFASHIPTLDDLRNVFNDCEFNEIERLFIPKNFKMDLRAPAGGQESRDMYDNVLSAIRGLCNRMATPWLDEVVLV